MEKIQTKNLDVMELDVVDMIGTIGGMGYDAGGYGLVYDRAKADGKFYKGFFKGLYDAIFN